MSEVLKPAVEVGSQITNGNVNLMDSINGASSTQIIESLYTKVDSLTNTNLQLTLQSQNMLEKLDVAQKKEVKLVENISMYKHQKGNLDTMLRRKLRKISELEEELASLQMTFSSVKTINKELNDNLIELNEKEAVDKEKVDTLAKDYDTLVQSQDSYRLHFEKTIDQLSQEMQTVKMNYINKLTQRMQNSDSFEIKLNKYKKLIDRLEKSGSLKDIAKGLKDDTCQDTLKKLDLDSWITLYKLSGKITQNYAEKNDLDLKLLKSSDSILNDPEIDFITKNVNSDSLERITVKKRTKSRNISGQYTPSGGYSPVMYLSSPMLGGSVSPRIGTPNNTPARRFSQRFNNNSNNNSNTDGSETATSSPSLPGVRRMSSIYSNAQTEQRSNAKSSPALDHRRKRTSAIYN
ncbi:SWI5-dependent HO expression protein 3 [Monosporozyma unispora]|nr:mother-specific HO expression [Kazachstania unispora]